MVMWTHKGIKWRLHSNSRCRHRYTHIQRGNPRETASWSKIEVETLDKDTSQSRDRGKTGNRLL